jgi:AAA domain-containing protein
MLFKDVSEVHNLAVKLNDPTLFDKVVKGAINGALKRHKAPPPSLPPIGVDGDGGALRIINAKDFPKDIKPRECVVSGIVPEKHITTLYGSGGSTKSILGMSLAMAAARGDVVWLELLMSGKSYRALFVDFELDLEAQAARLAAV